MNRAFTPHVQRVYTAMLEAGMVPTRMVEGALLDEVAVVVYHPAFPEGSAGITWAMLRDPDLTPCELRDLFARLRREGALPGQVVDG